MTTNPIISIIFRIYAAPFSHSFKGRDTIRAFGKQFEFMDKSAKLVDEYNTHAQALYVSRRWMDLYLDLLGSLIILASGILGIVGKSKGLSSSLVALCLSYSMQVKTFISKLRKNYIIYLIQCRSIK